MLISYKDVKVLKNQLDISKMIIKLNRCKFKYSNQFMFKNLINFKVFNTNLFYEHQNSITRY